MKYLILPIYYILFAFCWFLGEWTGCIIETIVEFKYSKPKYILSYWHNGIQILTDVEFSSPWEYVKLSIKNLYKIL